MGIRWLGLWVKNSRNLRIDSFPAFLIQSNFGIGGWTFCPEGIPNSDRGGVDKVSREHGHFVSTDGHIVHISIHINTADFYKTRETLR